MQRETWQRSSTKVRPTSRFLVLALALSLVLPLLHYASAYDQPTTARATSTAADWPTFLHDPMRANDNTAEATLSPANAGLLTKLWSLHTSAPIEASAVVSSGTVYIGSWDGYEYALDQGTGAIKWKTYLGQTTSPQSACNPPYPDTAGISSSPTILNGIVYLSGGDSNFYALNASTGGILWSVFINNTNGTGYYNYSSPVLANGFAYVGLSSYGNCPSVQGAVIQIDLNTHQVVHRFNIVPDGAGGSIWSSPAYDAATNTVYVTTGEDNGTSNPQYTDSILALSGTDLTLVHSWMIPHDSSFFDDADFGSGPVLFADGSGRTLVGAPNKNGYFYALDRSTFQLVWSYQVGDQSCDNPVTGCGSISPAAFANDVIYVAGGHTTMNGTSCAGSLRALKADNGMLIWQYCEPGVVMGAVAHANGILVVGTGNTLEVHNAASGALLYSYQENTSSSVFLSASPVIANGQVLEGSSDGTFLAFGVSTPTPTPTRSPSAITATATRTTTPVPPTGTSTRTRTATPTPTHAPGSATATPTRTRTATPTGTRVPPTATRTPTSTPPPVPPPAFMQGNSAVPQTSQATVRVTYAAAQRAGDTNIVAIGWNDTSASISAVTDSTGNTYQVAAPLARGSGLSQAIYYAKHITAAPAGGNTITVTFNQPAFMPDVRALEYGGLDPTNPFDAAASAAGSGSLADSGAATTHAANELLFGTGMTVGAFSGPGSGYTSRMITSPDADIAEDRVASAAGSYHATAAVGGVWLMQVAAFKPARSVSMIATATRSPTPVAPT